MFNLLMGAPLIDESAFAIPELLQVQRAQLVALTHFLPLFLVQLSLDLVILHFEEHWTVLGCLVVERRFADGV
jgi:hypothetical protein